jgi:hypothetical protein
MGSQISIDRDPPALDDLLSAPFSSFKPSKLSVPYAHHLKMWRFSDDSGVISAKPVALSEPQAFRSTDCYLVLLIYTRDKPCKFVEYPHAMWGLMETLSNLSPRGLENFLTSDDSALLDTLLLARREVQDSEPHYMLFVWNGKTAGAVLKAYTLTKGFELDKALMKGRNNMLVGMFLGVSVVGKKIGSGEVVTLEAAFQDESSMSKKPDCEVFLLQWLWPDAPAPAPPTKPLFPRFREFFLSSEEPPTFVPVETKPVPKLSLSLKDKPELKLAPKLEPKLEPKLDIKLDPKPEPKVDAKPDTKPKMGSLSLSGLKTREQERMQLQGLSKKELDMLDENFDVRETNRKDLKLQYYGEVMSELDSGLFVGSDLVARDKAKLQAAGVTHVINCAANVCRNYYPADFTYLHFFLKDTKTESIECVFYPCISFIESALKSGGKVLVHCMQGVSRSVTICLSYIIYLHKRSFEQAFFDAKSLRGICSPNTGFQVQLIWWSKRLCDNFEALPVAVRVFAVGSLSKEQPHCVVARLLVQPLYSARDYQTLDPRGVFLVQTANKSYLWVGSQVPRANKAKYMDVALQHFERIRLHEFACKHLENWRQGEEGDEFWTIWKDAERECVDNQAWDEWFRDLAEAVDEEPQELQEDDEEEEKIEQKPKLFIYPETEGLGVFEDDELTETAFLCLCTPDACFKWVGEFVRLNEPQQDDFIAKVTEKYYGQAKTDVINEEPGEESFEFLNYF